MSDGKLQGLMEALWEEVQDMVILDVAQGVHRAQRWKRHSEDANSSQCKSLKQEGGSTAGQQQRQQGNLQITPLAPQRGTKGPVDVFGQSHPAKATEVVTCRNCNRQVQAGMFAPHLEKCMGKGRAAGRAASKRIQAQTRLD
uniref:SAGA-associated factor 11 n=1 Tax=Dunaliella tertiolecta TaxID=3047 RepID=A0A7S3VTK9_DUNTE|mmetsp:Transcript_11356/g.30967  ORF Transcript_11356/g.30967 Transcript_11356/m.30967 type:complete len:142 (-) Transcript_11356:325-750(-)|eukprot:CAMPEP_0202342892 /NCGR_PEP_ID=MMETSP1126-20121109/3260_1 /ASSEMBLY_ACC=CAM_ASM_000457 /TAXON_ID=3047 /ORGANISM="Dunaliella tertiolecta, Strain CCMP1320" /LENGTH=141 /DNA_ID=CAMNT_0048933909 /DNA_START=121 /DNA_END=546 /DNA_ORIENTATION=+